MSGTICTRSARGSRAHQTDIRELWLTGGATPDCLHLLTGVYWEANAERLIAIDAATGEARQRAGAVRWRCDRRPDPFSRE